MVKKTVAQTKVEIGSLMQPQHSNIAGNVHGGEIMKMMDDVAGIVAFKHAKSNGVTARVDSLEFIHPIHIGNHVKCIGQMTFVGNSSMEVLVTVFVEDVKTDEEPKVALSGYFTYVALDENGRPKQVPGLEIKTLEEEKLFEEGKKRYLQYKNEKNDKCK